MEVIATLLIGAAIGWHARAVFTRARNEGLADGAEFAFVQLEKVTLASDAAAERLDKLHRGADSAEEGPKGDPRTFH